MDRRAEILDAAESAFSEKGFAATKIDDIAERLGVAHGTIYGYFQSKQDLFLAVLEDRVQKLEQNIREQLEKVNHIGELIETLVHMHAEFLAEHGRLLDVGLALAPSLAPDQMGKIWERKERVRRTLIRTVARVMSAETAVSAEVAADAVEGAVSQVMINRVFCRNQRVSDVRPHELEAAAEELKRILGPGFESASTAPEGRGESCR